MTCFVEFNFYFSTSSCVIYCLDVFCLFIQDSTRYPDQPGVIFVLWHCYIVPHTVLDLRPNCSLKIDRTRWFYPSSFKVCLLMYLIMPLLKWKPKKVLNLLNIPNLLSHSELVRQFYLQYEFVFTDLNVHQCITISSYYQNIVPYL